MPFTRFGIQTLGALASGKLLDFTFQSFLHVLGCGQLSLRNILVVFQLFQFLAGHRVNSFRNNGQNKSDQLFTVDRLWLGRFQFFIAVKFRTTLNLQVSLQSFYRNVVTNLFNKVENE